MKLVIYCADVGSIPRGNFAWACVADSARHFDEEAACDIDALARAIARDLESAHHVALGFEAPVFVPVPKDPRQPGRARGGEGQRAWSGGPGGAVLPTGIAQVAWLLREIRHRCPGSRAFTSWGPFAVADHGLFVWEALVTEKRGKTSHYEDACAGAREFARAVRGGQDPADVSAIAHAGPVLSLVGAALLWGGWTEDPEVLFATSPVIRAVAEDDIK